MQRASWRVAPSKVNAEHLGGRLFVASYSNPVLSHPLESFLLYYR